MSSSLSSPAGTSPFTSSPHELPVIAIIGTTGVGKSKLSIQLAQHITSRYRHHHPESTSPDPSDSSSLPSSRHIAPAPSFNDAAFPPSFVSDPSPYGLPLPPSSSAWRSAEVINADSMQVYRGLDIITNKVTPDETEGVPHRLLGVVDPKAGERGWGMMKWVGHALEEIEALHSVRSIPLLTGGTTYWIQHLLFPLGKPTLPPSSSPSNSAPASPQTAEAPLPHRPFSLDPSPNLPTLLSSLPKPLTSSQHALLRSLPTLPSGPSPDLFFPLWDLLHAIDPRVAVKWHWKDSRKVLRCLESPWNDGVRESEVWERQEQEREMKRQSRKDRSEEVKASEGKEKRFKTLIFWLHAPQEILDPRLDGRIDRMIELGLLDELRDMREIADSMPPARPDEQDPYTSGIFQAIGYKEFSAIPTSSLVTPSSITSGAFSTSSFLPLRDPAFQSALERMKTATRQYARSQVKWITSKLRGTVKERVEESKEGLFLLDAGDLDKWDEKVLGPAVKVLDAFLANESLPSPTDIGGPSSHELLGLDAEFPLKLAPKSSLPTHTTSIMCDLCSTPSEPHFIMHIDPSGDVEAARRAHNRGRKHKAALNKDKKKDMGPVYERLRKEAAERKEVKECKRSEAFAVDEESKTVSARLEAAGLAARTKEVDER